MEPRLNINVFKVIAFFYRYMFNVLKNYWTYIYCVYEVSNSRKVCRMVILQTTRQGYGLEC
jgi:hypothetical protein